MSIDWTSHETQVYDKITEWLQVIGKVLQDPAIHIRPENVYNMDETEVMLRMLGSVEVLVGRDDLRGHRGAGIQRTMVTAIERFSADGRWLHLFVIWPASTHRSNWTTYPTPRWHYGSSENDRLAGFNFLQGLRSNIKKSLFATHHNLTTRTSTGNLSIMRLFLLSRFQSSQLKISVLNLS